MKALCIFAFRLLLCLAAAYGALRLVRRLAPELGPMAYGMAAVVTAPLFALALRGPLLDAVAFGVRTAKERALADVQGRYFAFKGVAVDIFQDEEDVRWILVNDARKVVPGLARDEVLQRIFAGDARVEPGGLRLRADALAQHLRTARDRKAVRFKTWIEHDVLPGRLR